MKGSKSDSFSMTFIFPKEHEAQIKAILKEQGKEEVTKRVLSTIMEE